MRLPTIEIDHPPWLTGTGVPEQEQPGVHAISVNLMRLYTCVEDYAAAFALLEECQLAERETMTTLPAGALSPIKVRQALARRGRIAHRDSILTVYHFWTALTGISASIGTSLSVLQSLNRNLMAEARQEFEATFRPKDIVDARDSVAHAADPGKTPSKTAEHAVDGPFQQAGISIGAGVTNVIISNHTHDDTYMNAWEKGGSISRLSVANFSVMKDVYDKIRAAFIPVAAALERPSGGAEPPKPDAPP